VGFLLDAGGGGGGGGSSNTGISPSMMGHLVRMRTVCHIHSKQCDKENVGDSSLLSETRVKEHLSSNLSAIHKHRGQQV